MTKVNCTGLRFELAIIDLAVAILIQLASHVNCAKLLAMVITFAPCSTLLLLFINTGYVSANIFFFFLKLETYPLRYCLQVFEINPKCPMVSILYNSEERIRFSNYKTVIAGKVIGCHGQNKIQVL